MMAKYVHENPTCAIYGYGDNDDDDGEDNDDNTVDDDDDNDDDDDDDNDDDDDDDNEICFQIGPPPMGRFSRFVG